MQNKRGRAYYSLLPLILFGGIAPAYFKLIYYVPADEILTHRVIWSFFLYGGADEHLPPVVLFKKR